MTMAPGLRKFVLAAHVSTTVGWIGAIFVFIALAVVGLTSQDAQTVRGVYLVMEPAAWLVLVPLSFASLVTGVVQSLGTRWGLFRHYWVLFKFAITVYAVVVLVQYMETFGSLAEMASSSDDLDMVRSSSPLGHAVVALLLLLVATALSIYKPKGITRYDQYKQRALSQRGARAAVAVPKVLAVAGIVGPALFVVVLLGQDVLRSDYDPLAAATADPMIGPWGWVQQANFVGLGLLLVVFAVGLHRGVRVAGPGLVAPAMVALSGVGLVVAGFFPMTEDATDVVSTIRGVNNAIFAVSVGVGLVVLSWRFVRDVRWRSLADYAAVTGIAWFVIARITGAVAESGEAPYGLLRRVMLAVWLSCVVVLALRLRRVAQAGVTDPPARASADQEDPSGTHVFAARVPGRPSRAAPTSPRCDDARRDEMRPARRNRVLGTAMAAVALLASGACGGSSGDGGVAAADTAALDTGSQDADAQGLVFAECMRENGVDMPDPGPGQQGFYEAFHELEADYDQATLQQAFTACENLMPQFAAEEHGDDETVLALAECLRDQGLDVPDDLFESGALHDVDQDELMAAMEACRDVLAGGGQ